jgi:hypothetical protein
MSNIIPNISRIPIILFLNNQIELKGELVRYLSPLTVKGIISKLPFSQLVNNFQNKFLYSKLDLSIGVEKPVNMFKQGDIAFSPMSNSICIFVDDYKHNQQLSHIGYIKSSNLHELSKTKAGDILTIKKGN